MTSLLLAAVLAQVPDSARPDTALAIEGVLVPVAATALEPETWAVQLLQPIQIGTYRTNVVELTGNARRWARYADRYVEASGRLSVRPPGSGRFAARLAVERVREMNPPGMSQREVRISHTRSAITTLAVVPNLVRLPAPGGAVPQQVRPALLYTVKNIGTTDLEFHFPSSRAVCVAVEPPGRGRAWEHYVELRPGAAATVIIRIGVNYRQILPLPPEATPAPGRYTVRVSFCGVAEYELTTTLEVVGQ